MLYINFESPLPFGGEGVEIVKHQKLPIMIINTL
jgi:hypothetical protein